MISECKNILTKEKMNLEIQLIINRQLYEKNIIDKSTYEAVMDGLLKDIHRTERAN